jgi:septal ring-binding cell division protein DamX
VFLANPSYSRSEILHAIAEELGLPATGDQAASVLRGLQAKLIELYASGRRVVLMIDEAHAMPEDTLEQVRLLSNLESSRHKLLQIVLFGQPELDAALDKPTMRQLKDRITHSFRTRPLTADEAGSYIAFRMRAAGYKGRDVFTTGAIAAIARASSGLTRRINVLCDKSLLAAFAANTRAVTPREVRAAVVDSDFAPVPGRASRYARIPAALALLALGAIAGAAALYWFAPEKEVPLASAPVARPAPATPATPAPALKPPGETAKPPSAEAAAPPVSLLAPEKMRRLEGYAAGRHPMLQDRIAATRAKLEREPDSSYSIELFITENSDAARTERFLARARDLVPLSEIYVIPVATTSRYFLRVAYGAYPSKQAAAEAAKRLPPKYQSAFRFEPRSFAELRASI